MSDNPQTPANPDPLEIMEAVADPLLAMDTAGRVFYANPAAQRMLGMSMDELLKLTCHDLCSCEGAEHHCFLRDVVGTGKIYREESLSLMNLTGGEIHGAVTASPIITDGEIVGGVQVFRPLQRSGGIVQKLQKLATEDDLTGLLNRREFMRRFEIEMARAVRHKRPLSVMMLDLDHFKDYNDSHGHLAGDEALKLAAAAISSNCRAEDVAGRYGGEEFLLALPETGPENAILIAERTRRSVEGSAELDPPITVSIGLFTWDGEGHLQPDEIIAKADAALYEAKRAGRNRIVVAPADGAAAG